MSTNIEKINPEAIDLNCQPKFHTKFGRIDIVCVEDTFVFLVWIHLMKVNEGNDTYSNEQISKQIINFMLLKINNNKKIYSTWKGNRRKEIYSIWKHVKHNDN